jgi:hypothetical protein
MAVPVMMLIRYSFSQLPQRFRSQLGSQLHQHFFQKRIILESHFHFDFINYFPSIDDFTFLTHLIICRFNTSALAAVIGGDSI